MSEENNNNFSEANFFDQLMFGPPAKPHSVDDTVTDGQSNENSQGEVNNNSETPPIDMIQLMEQFDTLMGYANKIGPSIKKLAPLLDIFKGFQSPKK